MHTGIAVTPVTLKEWLICLAIIAVGWLIFAIGNRVFGRKNEGGKRLLLFVAGLAFGFLGAFLCRESWSAVEAEKYPMALVFYLGVGSVAGGVYFFGASIFASGKALDEAFETLLRSF
jgi:hypothetical protein